MNYFITYKIPRTTKLYN